MRWRHGDGTTLISFLPDGKTLLSVGRDATVRQWDVATGEELRRFALTGLGELAVEAANPPGRISLGVESALRANTLSADGKVLALIHGGKTVHLWDVAAGKEMRKISVAGGEPWAVALTSDSKTLAIQDADGTIRLHEVATGKETGRFGDKVDKDNPLVNHGVAFSPDGKKLVAVSQRGEENAKLTLWDTASGKALYQLTAKDKAQDFGHVLFSPDRKWLAWTGAKGIVLADAMNGKEVRRLKYGLISRSFGGFVFAPNGKTLIGWESFATQFHVWEPDTGKHLRSFRGPALETFVLPSLGPGSAAISPDGKLLALGGGATGLISLFDVAQGTEVAGLDVHRRAIARVSISRDGKQVFSTDECPTIRVWDATTGKPLRTIPKPHGLTSSVLSDDGQLLAVVDSNSLQLQETATGKILAAINTGLDRVRALAVSADNKLLAIVGTKGKKSLAVVYDVGGKELSRFTPALPTPDAEVDELIDLPAIPGALSFAPDGQALATVMSREKVALWDVTTGRELPMIELPKGHTIRALAFSSNGKSLAVDDYNDAPRLYETATGQERCCYGTGPALDIALVDIIAAAPLARLIDLDLLLFPIGDVAISPDSRLLAHSLPGGTIRLWDVAGGKELGQLKGHQADVAGLTFSAEGKVLASGSRDTTVLLWDVTKFAASAKPPPAKVDAAARWDDLRGDDAGRAFDAICALAAAPGQSVPYLKEHLHPAAPVDAEKVQRLIDELDSEQFAVRKNASVELEKIGEATIPLLRQALEKDPSAEARKRLEELLKKADNPAPRGETLRSLRAIEVLEMIGTAEAKAVLQTVAKGVSEATGTRAAQAALQRLER